jgi:hypothetical protein
LKNNFINILFLFFIALDLYAQPIANYNLNGGWNSQLPLTNGINDIVIQGDSVWFATERGLSLTADGGNSWINYAGTAMFDSKGISAFAIKNDLVWTATGYTTKLGDESIQTGGGLHYSTDRGATWNYVPQPIDHGTIDTIMYGSNKIRALDITVPQQNITFDIALTNNAVWIASWAGMLRKSIDSGKTWIRVILPPDNLDYIDTTMVLNFDLSHTSGRLGLSANSNHLLFSVFAADDSTIWVGTAGGINKSTDGGTSWRKFSHQNQTSPISGNWVVALKEQRYGASKIIWAATRETQSDETEGVSFSTNGGESWNVTLIGERAWNFSFRDSIVYVATDNGIFRSSDEGTSWTLNGSICDQTNMQCFLWTNIYGVAAKSDTVWCGGSDGIAYTIDSKNRPFGLLWKIFRKYDRIGNEKKTYAYPNPFAPDDESVRIHYSINDLTLGMRNVTIRIFDFAMLPVRTLIQNAPRSSGREYDEIWDGRNDRNSIVSNGVYFYRVEAGNDSPVWGKILVLK